MASAILCQTRRRFVNRPVRIVLERFYQIWKAADVRSSFIDYFKRLDYTYFPSASVVPFNDPSLYFVNAGMNQFKPIFLGTVNPLSSRAKLRTAVNSQKCVRASGKHNDFSDVGHDTYHHTFFEMLGNWSFKGAVSKKDVCQQALDLLCNVYKLPKERLFVTYFGGNEELNLPPDSETFEIWRQLGLSESQLTSRSAYDNFWQVESIGPCGPCTEIHYSFGEVPNWQEITELWNIVFIQYNKSDEKLEVLPAAHVDTGMGLERLTSILQKRSSNYETDLFLPIIRAVEKETKAKTYEELYGSADVGGLMTAYRVLADHSRMYTVAIADGVLPSSSDAGLVLRRVIRHSVYQASILNGKSGLLAQLATVVADTLGDVYPELRENLAVVQDTLNSEEDKFKLTLDKAENRFSKMVSDSQATGRQISSADLFLLSQTFGLSVEIIKLQCEKTGVKFNQQQFEKEEYIHKEKSSGKKAETNIAHILREYGVPITDTSLRFSTERDNNTGDYSFPGVAANVSAIIQGGVLKSCAPPFNECDLILSKSSFYPLGGGQVGDKGMISGKESSIFEVLDTFEQDGYVFHRGSVVAGTIDVGDEVTTLINSGHRYGCMQHHTGTHLLLAALEKVLNAAVRQRGSVVRYNCARLGFWSSANVTPETVFRIEEKVNELVKSNVWVAIEEMPLDEAYSLPKEINLRWLPGEMYPDPVRLVWILESAGNLLGMHSDDPRTRVDRAAVVSVEPCCGTHVQNTSDIHLFRILSLDSAGTNTKAITFTVGETAQKADEHADNIYQLVEHTWENICKREEKIEKLKNIHEMITKAAIPLSKKIILKKKILELTKSYNKLYNYNKTL